MAFPSSDLVLSQMLVFSSLSSELLLLKADRPPRSLLTLFQYVPTPPETEFQQADTVNMSPALEMNDQYPIIAWLHQSQLLLLCCPLFRFHLHTSPVTSPSPLALLTSEASSFHHSFAARRNGPERIFTYCIKQVRFSKCWESTLKNRFPLPPPQKNNPRALT